LTYDLTEQDNRNVPRYGCQYQKNVVIDDILAIEPNARAKNGIAVSLGIPHNA